MQQSLLKFYSKKLKWTTDNKLPTMQGGWIMQAIQANRKVKIVMWGFSDYWIGLKDNKGNRVLYKSDGIELTYMGTIPGDKK
jgi:hypothetical protein